MKLRKLMMILMRKKQLEIKRSKMVTTMMRITMKMKMHWLRRMMMMKMKKMQDTLK